jgi:hypothetical protein
MSFKAKMAGARGSMLSAMYKYSLCEDATGLPGIVSSLEKEFIDEQFR